MTEVDWGGVPSHKFEDMVACLLSHQNPKIRRIDGSGGDEGRDCQFDAPDGLHAFQIKKFNVARMGKAQRAQVKKSLKKAALLNPTDWTLIVPIDPTPGEKEWFDELAKEVSFPITWCGKTWPDREFAQRPFLVDYFLGDARKEVIDILRELNKEEGALANGLPDVVERVQTLVQRANRLDPQYRFTITADGTRSSVTVHPAYEGADQDRPITVKAEFRFPTTTEEGRAKAEEFQRALDFGTPVELTGDLVPQVTMDAPAGLGGTFTGPTLTMGPGLPVTTEPLELRLTISDPSGAPIATYELEHKPQTSGSRGTVLVGTDRGGYVHSEVTIDVKGGKYLANMNVRWERFIPHEFAPIARFLAHYRPPNRISIARTDGTMQSEPFPCADELTIPHPVVEFITNLAVIQAAAGIVREVQRQITEQDLVNAAGGVELLRGKEGPLRWTDLSVKLGPEAPLEQRRQMTEQPVFFSTTNDGPVSLDICGTTYPIGRRHRMRIQARVVPESMPGLLDESPTSDISVVLRPDPDQPSAWVQLID